MFLKKILSLFGIVVITMFFLSSSCKKDKKIEITPYYLNKEIKDYLDFKPGSYWIYRDTATKQEDSVYVFNYRYGISKTPYKSYELEWIHYNQKWKNKEIVTSIYCADESPPNYCFSTYTNTEATGGGGLHSLLYIDNANTPTNAFEPGADLIHYTTIKILDSTFTDVYFYSASFNGYNLLHGAYFKKHVGIVRMDFMDSTVYELVRYHVLQ
jgi:hypothetical protein